MRNLLTSLLLLLSTFAYSQSTTITPGAVLPQMTTAQRTGLANPVNGMMVYDLGSSSYWYYQNTAWAELPKAGSTSNYWELNGANGNEIKNTNSGGFWSANPTTVSFNVTSQKTAPIEGNGTRLMWIPSMSAFRVGSVTSNTKSWNKDSLGFHSIGLGLNVKASGNYSTAIGLDSHASGLGSTTLGANNLAKGELSTAIGFINKSIGINSVAIGRGLEALGDYSSAFGQGNRISSYGGTVIGSYNRTSIVSDVSNPASSDPIFQIGNGTSHLNRSNAMTVLRNSKVGINVSDPDAQLEINGFTKLGFDAPKIKVKKLIGITSSNHSNSSIPTATYIQHGISNPDKILSIDVMVNYSNNQWISASNQFPDFGFAFFLSNNSIVVVNELNNSSNIANHLVKIMIIYEE